MRNDIAGCFPQGMKGYSWYSCLEKPGRKEEGPGSCSTLGMGNGSSHPIPTLFAPSPLEHRQGRESCEPGSGSSPSFVPSLPKPAPSASGSTALIRTTCARFAPGGASGFPGRERFRNAPGPGAAEAGSAHPGWSRCRWRAACTRTRCSGSCRSGGTWTSGAGWS